MSLVFTSKDLPARGRRERSISLDEIDHVERCLRERERERDGEEKIEKKR